MSVTKPATGKAGRAGTTERASAERVAEIFESVKNWGRWGADDQRGALNLITPEKVAAAAALVQTGEVISCALEFPTAPSPENPTPGQHMMLITGDCLDATGVPGLQTALDYVGIAFHGMGVSHVDAFCHVFVDGRMYNDASATDVKSTGATRNSIHAAMAGGVTGRGVLLDIPRLRGTPWIDPAEFVTPEELSAAEEAQGVRVGDGDILLVSTGRDARRAAEGESDPLTGLAGLHAECVPWLRERDIAIIGSDGVSDPLPPDVTGGWPIPVHQCCLVAMGVHLLDNLEMGRLSEACARVGRWEFLFSIAPLRIARGTGSPINPLAVL